MRAIERADQFAPGTRLDRWLFAILRSIWLNEIRARRIREGGGFVDAEDALSIDGARAIETNILAAQVLKEISRLPEAQRETVLLVYGEGYSYAEAASALSIPIGTVMVTVDVAVGEKAAIRDERGRRDSLRYRNLVHRRQGDHWRLASHSCF